ncbi:hypothetical protein SAMN05421780_101575 [Flexibacter flexilis DSM 6793]|uniref:Uncharacterized protein n=1 Tax=Flexibacter flexilis DSM 6793 TaxID=927664 RepID=A0A1I1E170_9BACT|nr:hypothetical protein [Flexibacter flexilis]SFB80945.1 hypothetical protein SAMN05421780_101575 [Flexibacter flexilis DSM 6793]
MLRIEELDMLGIYTAKSDCKYYKRKAEQARAKGDGRTARELYDEADRANARLQEYREKYNLTNV